MIDYDKLPLFQLCKLFAEVQNRKDYRFFIALNSKGVHYTSEQKEYVFKSVKFIGVRATSRLYHVPRRTIQRWFRAEGITVKRCPDWVYGWAYRRRLRQEKWKRRQHY